MKVTLEGCRHVKFEPYGDVANHNDPKVTCLSCYHRLRAALDPHTGRLHMVDDYPPGACGHPRKKPVSQALTAKRDYTDAMCLDCGRVLRHPDGPGQWEDVLFYGYIIKEETWSSPFG